MRENTFWLATHGVTRDKNRFVNTEEADYGWVLRTAGPEFKFPTDRYPALAALQLKRLNQFNATTQLG